MIKVKWNYNGLAEHYDKRADYSEVAVKSLLSQIGAVPGKFVADIGAGTGKLTKLLASNGLQVQAVEPNDEMMAFGVKNTAGMPVTWRKGAAEETGLPDSSVYAAFFGSSFNVVEHQSALKEVKRLLVPRGSFACMWNHRDLNDPLQLRIEDLIRKELPDYNYGSRREDPSKIIAESGLFGKVNQIEQSFRVEMSAGAFFEGWKSHATLERQAGEKFHLIISRIKDLLMPLEKIEIPYTTRIWFATLTN